MHPTDYVVHFSNVLILVVLVTDILWLRWLAVAAYLEATPVGTLRHPSQGNRDYGPILLGD